MRVFLFTLQVALLFFAAGCRRTDLRMAEYPLPSGLSQERQTALIQELRRLDPASPDFNVAVSNQTLYIRYDSMILARKNIEFVLDRYQPAP